MYVASKSRRPRPPPPDTRPTTHPLWLAFVGFVRDESSGLNVDLVDAYWFARHGEIAWRIFLGGAAAWPRVV